MTSPHTSPQTGLLSRRLEQGRHHGPGVHGPRPLRTLVLGVALLVVMGLAGCVTPQDGGSGANVATTPAPAPEPAVPAAPPRPEGPLSVTLMVPLSGPQAAMGTRLAETARQAVGPVTGPAGVRLTVLDTQGTPEGARAAAETAVRDGAALVLGPVFSVSAQAARPVLAAAGIPALSFSNNRAVAGDGLYLLGHLPGQQITTLLDHAAGQGHGRIAVIGPDTVYARRVAETVRSRARDLVDVQLFPSGVSYDSQVQLVRKMARTGLTGVVLPTTGLDLVGLSALFQYYDATPPRVRLLGTDLWEWPGTFAEGSLLGGWYVTTSTPPDWRGGGAPSRPVVAAAPSPAADVAPEAETGVETETETEAETETAPDAGPPPVVAAKPDQPERPEEPEPAPIRLSSGPGKLERIVMDAVALAEAWAAARLDTPPGTGTGPATAMSAFLSDPNGFRGYSGLFRLLPNGLNERGLHVLEVTADGPRVLRPAPTAFASAGAPTPLVGADDFARHPWLRAEYNALGPTAMPAAPPPGRPGQDGAPGAAPVSAPTSAPDAACYWAGTQHVCPPTS